MPIEALDHYNICTADLDRARRFYAEVVGLRDGERPPFGRPGAWMYLGEQAILHISTSRVPDSSKRDAFDHVAFRASGLAETRATLDRLGIRHQSFTVPDRNLVQVFFRDPDGAEIELVFSGDEAAAEIAAGSIAVDATRGRDTAPVA
ncbi:MAG: VOC family protein [bacterium]|jgi:catechol 2,3-dioxygenase-like lactoylglutathione lyase family enzyme|nr:VOC family protein [Betaproteobacteria bacterium]